MRDIIYYEAAELLKAGDLVILNDDDTTRRMITDEIPDAIVLYSHAYGGEYIKGSRVPTESLWWGDQLVKVLVLGGIKYYPGERKTRIKKALGIYRTRIVKCTKCDGRGEYEEEI